MKTDIQEIPKSIGHWKVISKIGQGSFGCIYSVENKAKIEQQKQEKELAVKIEIITNIKQMLFLQYQIYKQFEGVKGFPTAYEYFEQERFSCLVMDKFQVSLDKYALRKFPKQFVPGHTLLQIMYQTLKIIEQIHNKGYVYRDLKPANFMLKSPYQNIFIIDFGLCKKYVSNDKHISLKTNKKLVGTPIFCSTNTHAGLEQSRRDDLESWVWTCAYLSFQLPWEKITNKKQLSKEQQYEKIYKIKKQIKWDLYLKDMRRQAKNYIPNCIVKILENINGLKFQQKPNYGYIYKLIIDQFSSVYKSKLKENQIIWQAKAPLSQIAQLAQIREQKDLQKTQSPRKVRKINFKAPGKDKKLIVPQSLSLPLQQKQTLQQFLSNSN